MTAAIVTDRSLSEVGSVASVYTEYAAYLAGQAELAGAALAPALAAAPSLPTSVNASARLLWGPPVAFLATWESLITNGSRTPTEWNPTAYNDTAASLSGEPLTVLGDFYAKFNGTFACAALSGAARVASCADNATRAGLAGQLATLLPMDPSIGAATLVGMGVGNATAGWAETQALVSEILGNESGLAASWILHVWGTFPTGAVSAVGAAKFARDTVSNATIGHEPIPIPRGIYTQFVNAAGTASIVEVSFSVADDATNASGGDPVYADLPRIATTSRPRCTLPT